MLLHKCSERTSTGGWLVFLTSFFILICFYPYEFYSSYLFFLPDKLTLIYVTFIGVTFLVTFLLGKGRVPPPPSSVLLVALVQFIGYSLCAFVHGQFLSILGLALEIVLSFSLVSMINAGPGLVSFFSKYNIWILVMALLGTITVLLVVFTGFQPVFFFADRADGRFIYSYIITFSKSEADVIGFIRYAGFFDEPGAMGYWGLFAILINRLFIRNNRFEIVLIILLLFTGSMGYYLQLMAFLVLFLVRKENLHICLFVAVVFILGIVGINLTKDTEYGFVYDVSIGRILESSEEGQRVGVSVDNRAESTDNAFAEFIANPIFGTAKEGVDIGNNIYEPLANYGVVGTILIYFPFFLLLMLSLRNNDKELFKCLIVLVLGFFHRPFHHNILSFFILYSFIAMYQLKRLNNTLTKPVD